MSGTGTAGQREPVLPMGDTGDHGPRSEAGDHGTAEFARGADSDTRGVVFAVGRKALLSHCRRSTIFWCS